MGAVVISLVSRKGGCGKTSTAINVAAAYAEEGLRVLVVDMDSQASASQFYLGSEGVESLRLADTVAGLMAGTDPERLVQPTRYENVLLLPAHLDMHVLEGQPFDLHGLGVDVVLIDTPPDTTSTPVRLSLLASDFMVVPLVPEAFGVQAIISVQRLLASCTNPTLRLLGYFMSMKQRLAVHTAFETMLRRLHGNQVFDTEIPAAAAYKEAAACQKTIIEHGKRTAAAKTVRALANEIIERIGSVMKERGAA